MGLVLKILQRTMRITVLKVIVKIVLKQFLNFLSIFTIFIPKRKKLFVFIGRNKSFFIDNVKYLYLFKDNLKIDKKFVIADKNYYRDLLKKNNDFVFLFSIKGICTLIKANYVIVDNVNWTEIYLGLIYFLTRGAKKIQLWHGYPIKKIEYANKFDKSLQRCANKTSIKDKILFLETFTRCVKYDFLLIPTRNLIYDKIFKSSFKFDKSIYIGYPRNEFLMYPEKFRDWDKYVDVSLYDRIKHYKLQGYKIVFMLPTFREKNTGLIFNALDLKKLSEFGKKNKILFVIKPHPWDRDLEDVLKKDTFERILHVESLQDIYPYLPLSDMLISDLSSIIFDYLLLNKPILHFFPDKNTYLKNERDLYFNLESISVGKICYTLDSLLINIKETFNKDVFKKRREKIKKFIFNNVEHNSEKIFRKILING